MRDRTIPQPERTRVVAPSARVLTDAGEITLNGEWTFRLVGEPTTAAAAAGTIEVPSHWVLPADVGRGHPIYTNLVYPIPVIPPHTPDENPTAEYSRSVDVPSAWIASGRVLLRTDGIESHAQFWINGVRAGSRLGSRLVHELDVTDLLAAGANEVRIEVRQWSVGTYLEDQDQWWLPGIFRDVTLRHRPSGCLDDVWVDSSYDAQTATGTIRPHIEADAGAWPIRLQIPAAGIDVTLRTPDELRTITAASVLPWSDESPARYEVIVTSTGERIRFMTGFRSITVLDGVLLANGRPLKLRGVNRHEIHAERGRVFDEADARADLELMKRHNVNAIRTAHYPPHPRLLDLADEYGLWVMLECDLETHGFELIGWEGNPSDDPAWTEHFLDRIERTVKRDRNHPSVFSWSLGNESGEGRNLTAMAAWAAGLDPGRLVHYEGDHRAAYTRLYSRMYPALEEIHAFLSDSGPIAAPHHPAARVEPDEMARARQLPYLLVEYLHAMGTGPGGIADYERLIAAEPRIAGGFVWEWRDHALRARTPDGEIFLAYGGDFGETLHDGTFIADGLISADGVASTGLLEWAHCVSPVKAIRTDDAVSVSSSLQHEDAVIDLEWRIEVDGRIIASGSRSSLRIAPRSSTAISWEDELAAAAVNATSERVREAWLTWEIRHGDTAPEWLRGSLMHRLQHRLNDPAARVPAERGGTLPSSRLAGPGTGDARDGSLAALASGPVHLDPATGAILGIGRLAVVDAGLTVWRAPTDNDLGHGALDYQHLAPQATLGAGAGERGPSSADRWRDAGLDRLTPATLAVSRSGRDIEVQTLWAAAGQGSAIQCLRRWTDVGDGTTLLRVEVQPLGVWDVVWPRVGLHLALPWHPWEVDWFGLGPQESYPDMRTAAFVGRHRRQMGDLIPPQVRPQEAGHRSDVRELVLSAPGIRDRLRIRRIAGDLGFTLRPWSPAEITSAEHPHELPAPTRAHLTLDLAMHGLGSRSCGPDVRPEHQLRPRPLGATLEFSTH